MQMNGSGIICNGYLLCNPPTQDFSQTIHITGWDTPTVTISPSIGYEAICKITVDSSSASGHSVKVVIDGAAVPLGGGRPVSELWTSPLDAGKTTTVRGYVRYA